ncbi:hypothetical protein EVC10_014 [Rhizobium phage RHph_Y25]|nr:hypothetical protein EVC10_014 [Rhizobium phage RHph_Y25]
MAGISFDDLIPGDKRSGKTTKDLILFDDLVPPPDVGNQKADAASVFVDDMLFGLPGKAAMGMNALIRAPFTDKTVGEEYDTLRNQYQNARKKYAEENPVKNTAASIAGSIYGGAVTGGAAGNLIGRVAPRAMQALNSTYAGRMAGDAAAGAAQGALSAYGHDEDIGTGAAIGGLIGGASRPVIDAGGAVLNAVGGLAGFGNGARANAAVTEAMRRAGQTPDDVANALSDAAAQGQPEYMVADALGNSGQRMLTGVARSPGDMRQQIAEQLQRRQAGQGRRIQNALVEGFGNPQTQQQTEAALTALRRADADVNYPAARASAGSVDPSAAIARADEFLGTAGSLPRTNIANDSVEGAVNRARSLLTDGDNIVSDFDTAFRAKVELDSMIENANPTIAGRLRPIRDELDRALEQSSDLYANARDTFRRQSQDIEAANIGRDAAMRGRIEDTIPRFQGMTRPEQQASFRAGYVDPYIADVQKAAGPMTNKARPLISDATAAEFPAFAAPGQGQQLMDRIAREQQMFETTNAALGGSRTADNAADMADIQSFDPTMISAFATGGLKGAALHGLTKGVNALQGRNTATRDAIARLLLENNPQAARDILSAAQTSGNNMSRVKEALVRALTSGGAAFPALKAY